jgi:Protein of unknown function (DUF2786)
MSDPTGDQAKRSALLDKISALLAKTERNGCTEAAAELAQKLMAKYGLSLTELQAIPSAIEACEADATAIGHRRAHEVLYLSKAIAFYTDTKSWFHRHGMIHFGKGRIRLHESHGVVVVYFGLSADVQVAKYLTNTLRVMLDSEWSAFWRAYPESPKPNARTARTSFMRGMIHRLSKRLYEMKHAQSQDAANDCREIVLVKADIVENAYNAAFGKPRAKRFSFGSSAQPNRSFDPVSYTAGCAAGERASISSGALSE